MKKTLLIFRNRNNIMQSLGLGLGLDIETEYAISKNDSIRLTVDYLDAKFKTLKIFTNITVDGTVATEQVLDGNRPVQACRQRLGFIKHNGRSYCFSPKILK